MNLNAEKFLQLLNSPVKFRMFWFGKLPAAFFSGVRIVYVDESKCSVSIPFKWLTQNPFRSTYFASLAMAAEMSTGALAMMHIYKRTPQVSMLVTNMQAQYFKKAIGKTIFTCEEGEQIQNAIEEAVALNESNSITIKIYRKK